MFQTGGLGTQLMQNSLQKASRPQVLSVHHNRRRSWHLEVLWVVILVAVVYCDAGSRTRSRRVL
jgi:hypothetical protein